MLKRILLIIISLLILLQIACGNQEIVYKKAQEEIRPYFTNKDYPTLDYHVPGSKKVIQSPKMYASPYIMNGPLLDKMEDTDFTATSSAFALDNFRKNPVAGNMVYFISDLKSREMKGVLIYNGKKFGFFKSLDEIEGMNKKMFKYDEIEIKHTDKTIYKVYLLNNEEDEKLLLCTFILSETHNF